MSLLEEIRKAKLRKVPEDEMNHVTFQEIYERKLKEDQKKTNNPITISLYDEGNEPQKYNKKIRFGVVSDTHNRHYSLNLNKCSGDVLIHCGDFTDFNNWDYATKKDTWPENVSTFNKFLGSRPLFNKKIIIAGNHDYGIQLMSKKAIGKALRNAIFLNDSSVVIENKIKIYGTSWNNADPNMAFYSDKLEEKWKLIPRDTNILITHFPPIFQGNDSLQKEILKLKHLKVHCYGHEHESYGFKKKDGVMYINGSSIKNMKEFQKKKNKKKEKEKEKKKEEGVLKSNLSSMNPVIMFDYYM